MPEIYLWNTDFRWIGSKLVFIKRIQHSLLQINTRLKKYTKRTCENPQIYYLSSSRSDIPQVFLLFKRWNEKISAKSHYWSQNTTKTQRYRRLTSIAISSGMNWGTTSERKSESAEAKGNRSISELRSDLRSEKGKSSSSWGSGGERGGGGERVNRLKFSRVSNWDWAEKK